jgi:arsenical pump membrane protein
MIVAAFAMAMMLAIVLAWRTPWAPALAGIAGLAVALAGGAADTQDVERAARDLWRPLLAIVSVMVTTACAAELGVFGRVVGWIEPRTRGPVKHAFRLVFVMSAIAAAVLSNDAAVLLLTPLVIELLRSVYPKRNPKFVLPFAFAVFVAAGVAPLPTSNPMNLVVASRAGIGLNTYASYMLPIALAGWLVAYAVLAWYFREPLTDDAPALGPAPPRVVLGTAGRIVFAVAAASIASYPVMAALGRPLWVVATTAGAICLAAAVASGVEVRRIARGVSWELLPFLFSALVIALALSRAGAIDSLAALFRDTPAPHATIGAIAAAGSAVLNNHPMSLLDSVALAGRPTTHVLAALVGGDLGPRFLPTGSLAGIMWLHALRRQNVHVRLRDFVKVGALVTIPTLIVSLGLLALLSVAGGCGGSSAPSCEASADRVVPMIYGEMRAELRVPLRGTTITRCKADGWAAEARTCMADANTKAKMLTCLGKLTRSQADAYTTDAVRLARITPVTVTLPDLPPPDAGPASPVITIEVESGGVIIVDGKRMTQADLETILRAAVAKGPHVNVTVQAADQVQYAELVAVMDIVNRFRTVNLSLSSGAAVPLPPPAPALPSSLVIEVAADGAITVTGKPMDVPVLSKLLAAAVVKDPDTQILIKADRTTPHGEVVRIIDLAKAAGLRQIAIATASP